MVHVDISSDEDIKLPDIRGSVKIDEEFQNEDDFPSSTPTFSLPLPKSKRQRVKEHCELPATPQQLGTLDLLTTLRADTSFDGNIWSQTNDEDKTL